MKRLACLVLFAPIAQAQFALEDFAATDCGVERPVFRSGLENEEGATGAVDFSVTVTETSRVHAMRLYVPGAYTPTGAWPLVVALHGSAQSPPTQAGNIRALWQATAEAAGALVLAPVATGNNGGWAPANDTPAIACAIVELERRYAVDRTREYLWGFSAGAHYGHAVALANSTRFAAYAVNAGALEAFACSASSCPMLLPAVARTIPVQLRVGTNDPLEPYTDADEQRFLDAGWASPGELRKSKFVGGHMIGANDVAVAWSWFEMHALPD